MPAAADEVPASIAQLFSQHAANYQATAAQAAAFQEQFVQNLTAGAFSYASIEAAIASLLQDLNVSADSFVSQFAAVSPQSLLEDAKAVLLLAEALPALLGVALFLLILVAFFLLELATRGFTTSPVV